MSKEFSLRDYQREALDVIHIDLQTEPVVLLQAIMGAGKTVTVARLINRYWFETKRDFLILAHKKELVEQFVRTFDRMTDVPMFGLGVCCAGLNMQDFRQRLTVGTIQTFVGVIDNYSGCDLLVIDEAHRVEIGTGSQYDRVITALRAKRPNMRILGLTATPSRLGHGYCYGDRCRPGSKNLFPRLNHQIKYARLLAEGHLVQLHGKVANADSLVRDLAEVEVNGDYVLNQLGEIMSREIHLRTAVQAIREHCGVYARVCVFCCTIDHAERLAALLGGESTVIHSQLTPLERVANLEGWKHGEPRIITSINILAEGFDFPSLDCLVHARPTMSSTLYLQSVGRVLRTSPGKDHGFLLDLTDNTARFGTDLDNVKVTVPKMVEAEAKKKDAMWKLCPMCEAQCHTALRVCACGFVWSVPEVVEADHVPELGDVDFQPTPPAWYDVTGMEVDIHESKKNGKLLGKITLAYGRKIWRQPEVRIFFCLPDYYNGFAVQKSRARWKEMAPGVKFPETVDDFLAAKEWIMRPDRVLLNEIGKYPELVQLGYDQPSYPGQEDFDEEMKKFASEEEAPF